MLLTSKIFKVKRKGVRDDVLVSNILFNEVDVSYESTDSLRNS